MYHLISSVMEFQSFIGQIKKKKQLRIYRVILKNLIEQNLMINNNFNFSITANKRPIYGYITFARNSTDLKIFDFSEMTYSIIC